MLDTTERELILPKVGPRLTLTHRELRELGITHLPPAGTVVDVHGRTRVVHASTTDDDADGSLDSATVVLEFNLAETKVTDVPEERKPVTRGEAADKLYESPRHLRKNAERNVGGSPHVGEFGVDNRRKGA